MHARHGIKWTDEDLATLRRMAEAGERTADIAKALQRNREALSTKAAQLKIRLRS